MQEKLVVIWSNECNVTPSYDDRDKVTQNNLSDRVDIKRVVGGNI
jgi:hypothetical protein